MNLKVEWDPEQTAPLGLLRLLQMVRDVRLGLSLLLLQIEEVVQHPTMLLILLLK